MIDAVTRHVSSRWLAAVVVAAVAVTAGPVDPGHAQGENDASADDPDGWLNYVDYHVAEGGEIDDLRAEIIDDIDGAEHRIDAAISKLEDDEIRAALIDAADRGVEVRVVADEQFRVTGEDGFGPLVDHSDVSVVFGDGPLSYLPEPNLSPILQQCTFGDESEHSEHRIDCHQAEHSQLENAEGQIERPDSYNVMSHTFFAIDEVDLWNVTAPLGGDQNVWLAFRAVSEEITDTFRREFRQMHGGVFSTTLSVYNGPLKSITQQRPLRLTNRGQLRIRFNPQERLVKNVIDEVLAARSSVFIITENLTNFDLIEALKYKQNNGFGVRVMVGQSQSDTDDVEDAIEPLDPVVAPESMGRLPSFAVFDSERDRNGDRQPRTIQMLSHELLRVDSYEVIRSENPSDIVRFYPSDTFADGVMWEIVESGSQRNPAAERFVDTWESMWEEAQ